MEFSIRYDDGFFEIKTRGDAEVAIFKAILHDLVSHEKWKPGTPFLVDHSELNAAPLRSADLQTIAGFNAQYSTRIGKAKCAHLLVRDLEYGMARMWEVYMENRWEISSKLFKSRDEAVQWLKEQLPA